MVNIILSNLYYGIIFLPLLGWALLALFGHKISKTFAGVFASGLVGVSFCLSVLAFFNLTQKSLTLILPLFEWMKIGKVSINLSFLFDPLSIWMCLIITGVGCLIHIYSIGYMHDDPDAARFFSYLNLFSFFMLVLVISDNFLGLFIGWEGVGLCSYLLIGFWNRTHAYNEAAKKAFIMNRIGDLGLILGIFFLLAVFHSTTYSTVFSAAPALAIGSPIITIITLLFFVGVTGKSAQIPLYTWLPDAMAGPTPVSALIHAATMVIAGIYLIARAHVLFEMSPLTMSVIVVVGAATALWGALIAVGQQDIKKVLAYSTMSQLGYMVVALGLGAFSTSLFHMTTHAFFKALLFLAAGAVIHSLSGEQNIFRMGGLWKKIPATTFVFFLGVLAIAGCPPFSGFFSKDAILVAAAGYSSWLFVLMTGVSLLTAFYMFRLFYLVFLGNSRGDAHPHESPKVMLIPLFILSVLSAFAGLLNLPEHWVKGQWFSKMMSASVGIEKIPPEATSHLELFLFLGTVVFLGLLWFGAKQYSVMQAKNPDPEHQMSWLNRLLYRKFYIDELYDFLFVRSYLAFSRLLEISDRRIVDGIVQKAGGLVNVTGRGLKYLQSGDVGNYLLMLLVSVCFIWLMFTDIGRAIFIWVKGL